jgi:hypothetical protein
MVFVIVLKPFVLLLRQILALTCITKGCHTTHHNICALQEFITTTPLAKQNPIIINVMKRVSQL